MEKVLPSVVRLVEFSPSDTVFTRFLPPERAEDLQGTWRRYYQKWQEATREHLAPDLIRLMPVLEGFVPPASVFDKPGYSAFSGFALQAELRNREIETLILSGSETDICVLSTALAAVDLGYRVVVTADAVCSSSDEGHDTLLALFSNRFSEQIEVANTDEILESWAASSLTSLI